MSTRALPALCALLLPLCGAAAASATTWDFEVACGLHGSGGDLVSRGIYVTNYGGSNLGQVQLDYSTDHPGLYRISLTAHRGNYDGPIIGSTQVVTINLPDITSEQFAIFDFGGAPVTPGDTIAFTQAAQGLLGANGGVFFDIGTGSCPDVFENSDTTHGLANPQRDSAGIVITQQHPVAPCVASDNVMCIDDFPGDQRFKVTVTYHTSQGGGLSGNGQEIPMAPLGVSHGGLFWFFDPTNPEMLVKVIDGCALNQRFWVFISAGTNVGFTVTVHDTAFGATTTYTNQDKNPAPPIQDTSALTGCT